MSKPLAFINGELLPEDEAQLSFFDTGFVLGVTISEQMRTFHGELFRLDDHLDRMGKSLEYLEIQIGLTRDELASKARELTTHNHRLLKDGNDLGLVLFATPGPYRTIARTLNQVPTVGMHTYPLPFGLWADRYKLGQSVFVSSVQQVPAECWPRNIKCRSRLHYHLADREARKLDPQSRAILVDENNCILEATTANIVIYDKSEGFVVPPKEKILPGISLQMVKQLARDLNIRFSDRDIPHQELVGADEVMLTSTPWCLLPVVQVDSTIIGKGIPGPIYRRLLSAWSEAVGVNISAQAQTYDGRQK